MHHKYRLHQNVVRIDGGGLYDRATADIITIGKHSQILPFLRHFGHKITKIYFAGFSYNPTERHQITEAISKYCSKSLLEMELIETGGHLMNATETSIFTKLKKLKVRDDKILYENPQIHRIYPALKELSLALGSTTMTEQTITYIRHLLMTTPQLQSFETPKVLTYDFVQSIEVILPHLTSLAIGYVPNDLDDLNNRTIHFNRINRLTLNLVFFNFANPIAPFPFTFTRLEALEIATTKIEQAPISLFERNIALKSLSFPTLNDIDGLLTLLSQLRESHNIEVLTLQWTRFMGSDNTRRLLNEFDGLKEMMFVVFDGMNHSANRDALLQMIPDQWNVSVAQRESVDARIKYQVLIVRK